MLVQLRLDPIGSKTSLVFAAMALLSAAPASAIDLLVYNNNNSGPGSLRQAINDNNALGGGNTITFSNIVTGSITLTNGELLITRNVTIVGPSANVLAISGNGSSRVFQITNSTVSISGLGIINGQATNGAYPKNVGGGILTTRSAMTLSNCTFLDNSAIYGGGIYNDGNAGSATLTVTACTFINNSATYGGGIDNYGFSGSATLTVKASTFFGNSATEGGGIDNDGYSGSATLTVTACTLSGNSANSGGGIYNYGPAGSAMLEIGNTILSASVSGGNLSSFNGTVTSDGYNLCSDNGGGFLTGVGDQINTDPMLGPLQYNGGPTPTFMPLSGSPAIDQGKSFGLTTDQRGRPRPYDNASIINATFGDGTDIGAAEYGPVTLVVTSSDDHGPGSLRQAILDAAPNESDTVTFAPSVTNPIVLTSGEIVLNKDITIEGPAANPLTASGNNLSRVFHQTGGNVNCISLNIANGRKDYGGGILVDSGVLALLYCQVVSNAATGVGGGIYVDSNAALRVTCSSITHNQALISGGGIAHHSISQLTIETSTIASNRTTYPFDGFLFPQGGGIWLPSGTLVMVNSTVASNFSTYVGGGICNGAFTTGTADIRNSIIAGNAAANGAPDAYGPFTSGGYNLIGNSSGSTGFTNTGDQLNLNPLLGPLANYGGPTLTLPLRAGSPAIDRGNSFGATTDQRGAPRPFDLSSTPNAGDGSDIGAFELGSPQLNIRPAPGNNVVLSWPSYYGDFILESVMNLSASNNWSAVTNPVIVIGNQLSVTNATSGPKRFYRLKGI